MSVLVSISSGVGSGEADDVERVEFGVCLFTQRYDFIEHPGIEVVHVWNEVHLTVCVECLEKFTCCQISYFHLEASPGSSSSLFTS